jgi:hypothetical protein
VSGDFDGQNKAGFPSDALLGAVSARLTNPVRPLVSSALAVPGRLRKLASALDRRTGREQHRPPLVLSLEPVSADWLHDALTSSLRCNSSAEQPAQFRVVRASSWQDVSKLAIPRTGPTIIVAHLDRWEWQVEKYDVLYLRPGLLLLHGLLPGIFSDWRAGAAVSSIRSFDKLLCRYPAISLETLFYEPTKAAESFNLWLGAKLLGGADLPLSSEDGYRRAMLAILQLIQRYSAVDRPAMISFPVGGTYATTSNGTGTLALGDGWSWPESQHTWTDGPRASLAIPIADTCGKRLHLRLNGRLAAGAMSVRVFACGQLLMEMMKGEAMTRDQPIMLSLPHPLADPVLSIEFEFSNTFCPRDAGVSLDGRHLGFALRSFAIIEETLLSVSLRTFIRWRSPKLTVGLEMPPPDKGFGLSRLLAECGLSGSLITVANTRSDGADGLQHENPTCRPDFTATARYYSDTAIPDVARQQDNEASPTSSNLREICFSGTLPQLLNHLERSRSFPDLIVLSSGRLFGRVLDALDSQLTMPDIAICTDVTGFFDRSFWQSRSKYERVVHRFARAIVDPQLVCLTGRAV